VFVWDGVVDDGVVGRDVDGVVGRDVNGGVGEEMREGRVRERCGIDCGCGCGCNGDGGRDVGDGLSVVERIMKQRMSDGVGSTRNNPRVVFFVSARVKSGHYLAK